MTPELVRLFKEALAADEALRQDSGRQRRRMTPEQHNEALAVVHAFCKAADVKLWERFSPLHPRASDHALQTALLAELTAEERKRWDAYCRRYWKRAEAEQAEEQKARASSSSPAPALPRLAPNLKWGGHW